MEYSESTDAAATIEQAWAALSAVTAFPQWTKSMTTVTPLDTATLEVGHRFRIKQPGFPPVTWRVSEVREGESFTWEATSPGLRSVAHHRLSRNADGSTRIVIGVAQTGVLSALMGMLTAAKTRRFLTMEAAGLKSAAEAAPSGLG